MPISNLSQSIPINAEAYLLAGGMSRRFGSDKARYLIQGVPMIKLMHDRLMAQFPKVTVIAKESGLYDDLGCVTVSDDDPTHAPIVGIVAALKLSRTEWTFVAACDLPYLDATTIEYLWEHRDRAGVVPETDGQLHPLSAFYHRSSRSLFSEAHIRGRLGIKGLISKGAFHILNMPDPAPFENLNERLEE